MANVIHVTVYIDGKRIPDENSNIRCVSYAARGAPVDDRYQFIFDKYADEETSLALYAAFHQQARVDVAFAIMKEGGDGPNIPLYSVYAEDARIIMIDEQMQAHYENTQAQAQLIERITLSAPFTVRYDRAGNKQVEIGTEPQHRLDKLRHNQPMQYRNAKRNKRSSRF